jgi:hypothetical protein
MTDLSVLIPDSMCASDIDRFCDSVRAALLRNQQLSRSVVVEFVGVSESATERNLQPETGGTIRVGDALLSALNKANGSLAIWVPDPNRSDAADRTVDLFARRRSLPVLLAPQCERESVAGQSAEALTPVSDVQTGLLTPVCASDAVCVVLRNRFSVPRPEILNHRSTPWIERHRPSGAVSIDSKSSVSDSSTTELPPSPALAPSGPHPASLISATPVRSDSGSGLPQTRVTLRPIVLAALITGTFWFFWGGESSMTAATGQPVTDATTDGTGGSQHATGEPANNADGRRQVLAAPTVRESTSDTRDRTAAGVAGAARSQPSVVNSETVIRDSADNTLRRVTGDTLNCSDDAIEQRLLADATYLAADDLEGRGAQTQGLERAAEYLARQFADAGLNTSHYNGTPFQEFELLSIGGDSPVQQVEFAGAGGATRRLVPDQDFASLVLSRSSKLNVGVTFAGFGISAPEVGYDDYQGLDVSGTAVVILRHAPKFFSTEADDLAEHSYVRTKIAAASARGASAVLLCSDLESLAKGSAVGSPARDRLLNVELTLDDGVRPIPVIHCRRDVLTELLSQFCDFDLDAVERGIATTSTPASQPLKGLTLAGRVSQLRRGRTLKNVIASLDPPDSTTEETIIVGAHYDHLGRGGWGSLTLGANDEVHNGADDNASGTAVLLEVARQLAALETPLQRRVLFIGFSAEELGLIGSRKYVKEPLIPIEQSVAMLNLDMVGRLRSDRLTVYGTGSSKSWTPLLDAFAPHRQLTIIGKASGYGPSDHASFYEVGVPVLHFFTGFHPQYHRPEDDVEHLNIDGMRRIASLVVDLVTALSQAEDRPQRSLASDPDDSGLTLGLAGLNLPPARPTLGIVPADRQNGQTGVVVRQTLSRSLAHVHGIRTGDVIVRIGNSRIDSVEQLATEVRAQRQGEALPIELLRNGIRMEVRVQF